MARARFFGLSLAALRNSSLMRRCHPAPRLRKCATTSRSSRIETSCLVGAFCGPRRRRYSATISGAMSTARRARAHMSSVISNASGSRAIPAAISASSSSVIVASWRKALRRASRQTLSDCFGISSHVALSSFPQADDPDPLVAAREDENMEAYANVPNRDFAQLTIVLAIVDINQRTIPIEFVGREKIDLMVMNIGDPFRFIPIVRPGRFHRRACNSETPSRQPYRSYNLMLGAAL